MSYITGEFVREAIENRINKVRNYGWEFATPEIESYFLDLIADVGVNADQTPSGIVDNAILNGEHGILADGFMNCDEGDDDFIEYLIANGADETACKYDYMFLHDSNSKETYEKYKTLRDKIDFIESQRDENPQDMESLERLERKQEELESELNDLRREILNNVAFVNYF